MADLLLVFDTLKQAPFRRASVAMPASAVLAAVLVLVLLAAVPAVVHGVTFQSYSLGDGYGPRPSVVDDGAGAVVVTAQLLADSTLHAFSPATTTGEGVPLTWSSTFVAAGGSDSSVQHVNGVSAVAFTDTNTNSLKYATQTGSGDAWVAVSPASAPTFSDASAHLASNTKVRLCAEMGVCCCFSGATLFKMCVLFVVVV